MEDEVEEVVLLIKLSNAIVSKLAAMADNVTGGLVISILLLLFNGEIEKRLP